MGLNLLGLVREPRRRASYVNKAQFDDFSNQEEHFRKRYRFKRETVELLCELLRPELEPLTMTNNAFTLEQRVCCALRFFATGTFQMEVGDGEGASQSTMCRIISRVTDSLSQHANDLITFSTDPVILDTVSTGFFGFSGSKLGKMSTFKLHNIISNA